MDDEQQAWWTNPPRPPAPEGSTAGPATRPATKPAAKKATKTAGRAGPPEDPVELIVDYDEPEVPPLTNPRSLGIPLPPTAPPRSDGDPPTRPVEYLTVRLEPEPGPPRSGDTMDVPVAAMPRMRQAQPDRPASGMGIRRGVAIVIGIGVLLVVVAVAVIASKVATGVDPGAPGDSAAAVTSPAIKFPGTPPESLTPVSGSRADTLLRQAGHATPGTVKQAFTWTDKNGQNLVVTTYQRTSSGTTLRVVHVAGLGSTPRVLRSMIDPSLPLCSGSSGGSGSGGRAGFTAGSMFVRDLNGDSIAEVTVGWFSRCPGAGKSEAKLALISGTDKYIIRGRGVIGDAGSGTREPDPATGSWPPRYLKAATALYRALYF